MIFSMKVQVCKGSSCSGKYSKYITTRLENDTKFYKWKDVEVSECSCIWQCKKWANIKILNQTHNYMTPTKASQLILKELR